MIDLFVSYEYKGKGKRWIKADGSISLAVAPGTDAFVPPSGVTRGMIEALRLYLAQQHEVGAMDVHLFNVLRLEIDEAELLKDGDNVQHGKIPEEVHVVGYGDDDGTP